MIEKKQVLGELMPGLAAIELQLYGVSERRIADVATRFRVGTNRTETRETAVGSRARGSC